MQHLKESLNNFKQHKLRQFLAAITIGFSILILAFAFAFYNASNQKLANLSQNFDLQIFFKNSTSLQDIQRIKTQIDTKYSIQNVAYISSEKALENLESSFPNQLEFFKKYSLNNPLPSLLKIQTQNLNEQQAILNDLKNSPDAALILESQFQNSSKKVRENFFEFQNTIQQILIWSLLTFIVVLSLIIFNIVHLSLLERHKEIKIKQLIGADFDFIRKPFMIESLILAGLSFIIGFLLILTADTFVPFSIFSYLNLQYWILQILLCTTISLGSSFYIVEYHLRKQTFVHE